MAATQFSTQELGTSSVNKDDVDVTTTTKALITKVIAGTNISISSTGVDAGTGDVTINLSTTPRINPRLQTVTSSATVTPAGDTNDMVKITAQAANLTLAAPSGTPVDGQTMVIALKDNGTTRTITWNAIYVAIGVTLPTTTVVSKWHYFGLIYNSQDTKWHITGYSVQA